MKKPKFWFPTWSGTNQAMQSQKMARGLKFQIYKVEELDYLCTENKGADTAKLICVFVFAYAKCLFSHDAAHFCKTVVGISAVTVHKIQFMKRLMSISFKQSISFIPLMFLRRRCFNILQKLRFMSPWQPIKFRDWDKIHLKHRGLLIIFL